MLSKNRSEILNGYQELVFLKKIAAMAKNTSILLGEHFENFVNEKIATGKFSSVSEVIRTALRLLENEENRYKALIKELEIGEKSGFVKDFDRTENLKNLHAKHLKK
jgi:antitoxin ParD1/3/4